MLLLNLGNGEVELPNKNALVGVAVHLVKHVYILFASWVYIGYPLYYINDSSRRFLLIKLITYQKKKKVGFQFQIN
jgi:hypothetical protein